MQVLMIRNYKDCDEYAIPLDEVDTWQEVLSYIESALEDQFLELRNNVGCKINAEIVEMTDEEYENLVNDD